MAKIYFYVKKNPRTRKTTGRREDAVVFKRRITVMLLQVIESLIIFSLLIGGEGYLYELRDDVEVASISGGYNCIIFVVVTIRFHIYPYLLQSWGVNASQL